MSIWIIAIICITIIMCLITICDTIKEIYKNKNSITKNKNCDIKIKENGGE